MTHDDKAREAAERDAWVDAAAKILFPYEGDNSRAYAESLYQTFVLDDARDWTPADAVREDMSYWGE